MGQRCRAVSRHPAVVGLARVEYPSVKRRLWKALLLYMFSVMLLVAHAFWLSLPNQQKFDISNIMLCNVDIGDGQSRDVLIFNRFGSTVMDTRAPIDLLEVLRSHGLDITAKPKERVIESNRIAIKDAVDMGAGLQDAAPGKGLSTRFWVSQFGWPLRWLESCAAQSRRAGDWSYHFAIPYGRGDGIASNAASHSANTMRGRLLVTRRSDSLATTLCEVIDIPPGGLPLRVQFISLFMNALAIFALVAFVNYCMSAAYSLIRRLLLQSRFCHRCKYDLRGIGSESDAPVVVCPECGWSNSHGLKRVGLRV